MIKKSITVTDQQEAFIQAQLATGQFATDSEVIRDALRDKAQRVAELEALRAKLEASEQSGLSEKSPLEVWQAAKKMMQDHG